MIHTLADRLMSRIAYRWRSESAMKRFGIANLRVFAKRYNRWRYAQRARLHREAFTNDFPALLKQCGDGAAWPPRVQLADGWARDDSQSLPHMDRLLDAAAGIIQERGGKKHFEVQQPFLRNLLFPGDLDKAPALMDFIVSAPLLATVSQYLGTVPVLSKTLPPGLRFMESNAALDPGADGPFRESQLYHLDIHDTPLVYVLVLAQDVTEDMGPWTFLPASASARVTAKLRYQKRGSNYRLSDDEVHSAVDPKEVLRFTGKKGSVLFIDSSVCFHYGSRKAAKPRFQLMYGLTTPCRCDLFQTSWENEYPVPADAPLLRRLVTEPWRPASRK
ncbi:MAG: hypothetical protein NTW19_14395 [Planctomycetota bacterium]|nr:hypothetical protein [Planctomycetota bacterium]